MIDLRAVNRLRRRVMANSRKQWLPFARKLTINRSVLIHIPKCGGRALNSAIKKSPTRSVQWAGHATYRELSERFGFRSRSIRWVALTRNPESWYRSRLTFLRQHLSSDSPRVDYANQYNPFSALANFGEFSLDEYIRAVQNPRAALSEDMSFWERAPGDFLFVINWLERTGRGLYTMTILDHCASRPLSSLDSPELVDQALAEIGAKFRFIRNEELKADSERILGIEIDQLQEVGLSNQFLRASDAVSKDGLAMLVEMDGRAAEMTGGYALS